MRRGHAAEIEAQDDAPIGQPLDVEAPAHVPGENPRIERVALHRRGPALPPVAELHDDLPELRARLGQAVFAASARDHTVAGELAQPLHQQRARDARHAALDLVEAPAAEHQLAQDHRRPALSEHLGGDRHRAELAVDRLHGA